MGQLPESKISPFRLFLNARVDYIFCYQDLAKAREWAIKTWAEKNLVIFVCLSTSAMHKEIIMDYTTEVFISAYNTVYSPTRNLCKTIGLSGKFVSILKENW